MSNRNSYQQKLLKEASFKRDNFTCIKCNHKGKKGYYEYYGGVFIDLVADHIIPRAMGGEDTLDNMQTLCIQCALKKDREDKHKINIFKKEMKWNKNH